MIYLLLGTVLIDVLYVVFFAGERIVLSRVAFTNYLTQAHLYLQQE
jgi:hypothetical protein